MWDQDSAGLCTATWRPAGCARLRMTVERLPVRGWEWLVWSEAGGVLAGEAATKPMARRLAEAAAIRMAGGRTDQEIARGRSARGDMLPAWLSPASRLSQARAAG